MERGLSGPREGGKEPKGAGVRWIAGQTSFASNCNPLVAVRRSERGEETGEEKGEKIFILWPIGRVVTSVPQKTLPCRGSRNQKDKGPRSNQDPSRIE